MVYPGVTPGGEFPDRFPDLGGERVGRRPSTVPVDYSPRALRPISSEQAPRLALPHPKQLRRIRHHQQPGLNPDQDLDPPFVVRRQKQSTIFHRRTYSPGS